MDSASFNLKSLNNSSFSQPLIDSIAYSSDRINSFSHPLTEFTLSLEKNNMIVKTLNNKKNITSILPIEYLSNPDKFVYPFQIKEPNKIRTIITYNNIEQFGNNLRKVHEFLLDFIKENFAERNEHSFAYHKGVSCLDAL